MVFAHYVEKSPYPLKFVFLPDSLISQYSPNVRPLSSWSSTMMLTEAGDDATYRSKVAWGQLDWTDSPFMTALRHECEGPVLHALTQQFHASSPQQTLLYYKGSNGWKWVQTYAWALRTHEAELNHYVSRYTSLYLENVGNEGTLIDQVLLEAKNHTEVR